ncbi:MAG: hypothetical protein HQL54_07940 [Magnetococcales bacterium]|nr:hypothetical protein [Magnetococcales bacterium]
MSDKALGKIGLARYLLILLVTLLTACSGEVEMGHLDVRDGLTYLKNSKIPYTGPVVSYFPPKDEDEEPKLYMSGQFVSGRREGVWNYYSWNGERREVRYALGRQHGLARWFFTQDRKKRDQEFRNGRAHGGGTWWDQKGDSTAHDYYRYGSKVPYPQPEDRAKFEQEEKDPKPL